MLPRLLLLLATSSHPLGSSFLKNFPDLPCSIHQMPSDLPTCSSHITTTSICSPFPHLSVISRCVYVSPSFLARQTASWPVPAFLLVVPVFLSCSSSCCQLVSLSNHIDRPNVICCFQGVIYFHRLSPHWCPRIEWVHAKSSRLSNVHC